MCDACNEAFYTDTFGDTTQGARSVHYLDIELGQTYVYDGQLVQAVSTRIICKAAHDHDDETFVTIAMQDGTERVVKPHTLAHVPKDGIRWNALIERPIGFRRLP